MQQHVNESLDQWMTREPAQIVLTLNQIYWCAKVTRILQQHHTEDASNQAASKKKLYEELLVYIYHTSLEPIFQRFIHFIFGFVSFTE
jgi:hypothetical protein